MTLSFGKRTDRQPRNVLLVEGGSSARDRHSATLARNGYQVEAADTIAAAQNLFAPRKYALVVVSLNGFGDAAADFCNDIKESDAAQLIALIFHPDQQLPVTDCPTLIFTTEPDEYFLARVETLTAAHAA
jgi:response regulator RpfG family c-di-GMP phosphodiesterase